MVKAILQILQQVGGALVFYTVLPLPPHWPLDFQRIARWAPWIGLLLGSLLAGCHALLGLLALPVFLKGIGVTILWILITGGLHLDGVMDTADGLAVPDPTRRLEVMGDSRTGAYGVMAAIVLIVLKVGAIADLPPDRAATGLLIAPLLGRWAQLWAIAHYSYLKPEGKGAFHRRHLNMPQDLWPSLLLGLGMGLVGLTLEPSQQFLLLKTLTSGLAIAWAVSTWFYHKLQGMTGDSYGAIVEWTEALSLCSLYL